MSCLKVKPCKSKHVCKSTYQDIEHLQSLYIKNDILLKEVTCQDNFEHLRKPMTMVPFRSWVTLNLVTDPKVERMARYYLTQLLTHKKEYGILYWLADQQDNLVMKLQLNVHGEAIIDPSQYTDILQRLESLARDFFQPHTLQYTVTCVELLYFFTYLNNPHLNYLTMDYVMGCILSHRYIIHAPTRRVSN